VNTDELRAVIWDDLFRAKTTRSIDEIAALTDRDATDVRTAVSHEWFRVTDDRVAIAMAPSKPRYSW
jgi:hypothetical protein